MGDGQSVTALYEIELRGAVGGFGMLLQQSQFAGTLSLADVERIARGALGADRDGDRHELLELVARARGSSLEHARRD